MFQLHFLSGPETGQSFEPKDGGTCIGRSINHDIQLEGGLVPISLRPHLENLLSRHRPGKEPSCINFTF
jgi:hypothetical protein